MKRTATVAMVGTFVLSCVGVQFADARIADAADADSGFEQPFAGDPIYEPLGPPQLSKRVQLNKAIGQKRANEIAALIGLSPDDAFTKQQYRQFITGTGIGCVNSSPNPCLADAELVDESVRIFTNTRGRALVSNDGQVRYRTVLGSYGLFVDRDGYLESLANESAPTRKANAIIAPGGYLDVFCQNNGCTASVDALHASAYSVELPFAADSQQITGAAQLVTNTKGAVTTEVGMSMVPPIWLVNFALLYILKPSVAAEMPAYWTPIPEAVADAISADADGRVPYSEYEAYFR